MQNPSVPVAPNPAEIYQRAQEEGARRLFSSPLELVSTGFIAGFNIVFGVVALGITHALVAARFGSELGELAGALAFGIGLVFLVVGRSELFSENFLEPVAAAIERRGREVWVRLVWLWGVTLVLNLVGGAILTLILTTEGALPEGAPDALVRVAEEIERKEALATFTRAIAAGALLTLMTYLLQAANSVGSRIAIAYMVGFFVAIGPFDHVVVSALHLLFGMRYADIGYGALAANVGLSTAGNVLGGIVFVTLTHVAQAKGARAARE